MLFLSSILKCVKKQKYISIGHLSFKQMIWLTRGKTICIKAWKSGDKEMWDKSIFT